LIELLKQKTVLYAEDDLVTRSLYEEYFKNFFKTVYLAENGQQAIEIYHDHKPDVIFLDINMPVMTGLEACQYIRQKDFETKIVMLTVQTDKETLLSSIELGLSSYLEKPMSRVRLKQLLIKISTSFKESNKILIRKTNDQEFSWDKINRVLLCNSQIVHLTKSEKLLLELLVNSRHEKVEKQQVFESVWGGTNQKEYSEASFKTLLKRLRNKLPEDTITNLYGLGYSLNRSEI
jgi:DNA-binding response OmpR family regulator